jgi:putative ABC transport system ATP-binding protein
LIKPKNYKFKLSAQKEGVRKRRMITVKKLRKIFNKDTIDEKVAIDGVDLHINKGDFITIIGSNGAGKTTLLNLIAGTYLPDEGDIFIEGTRVTHLPEHRRARYLGRIFQDPLMGTAASMSIEENLAMAETRGRLRGLRWGVTKRRRETYKGTLSPLNLGLENRLKDRVSLLSGGQRQSLALLMATLSTPSLLLLDEHTASLDPKTVENVLHLTKKVVEENNLSTVMVTHNMGQAIEYGNRMVMLHEGKMKFEIEGESKKKLTVKQVVREFGTILEDKMLLSTP